jgi:protein-tyrosine phosphatase
MVDIHTHILYNIDDGSKNVDDSINILKRYIKEGIKKIVLTPHYIENSEYNVENIKKNELFNALSREIIKQNLNIELYLGNEVYFADNILDLLKENKIMTINNSKYILIELPMVNENPNVLDMIYNLKLSNITPIIAHPERYLYVQNDINKAISYIEYGALLQINKDSLFNRYGKNAKKTAKKLIKKQLVHFIASDIHSSNNKIYSYKKFKKKLDKLADSTYINKILEENGLKVLNNEEIK